MTTPIRILALSGSSRTGSHNRRLVRAAAAHAATLGAEIVELDLRELNLPLIDEDLEREQGVPAGAFELRRVLAGVDGVLLASPEYNALPPPLLLNALDWLSRVPAGDGLPSGMGSVGGKPVGLMGASPGGYGGIRMMPVLRFFLATNFAMHVVPETLSLGFAADAFESDAKLKAEPMQQMLERVAASVVRTARAFKTAG
ncbi:MAG: NAD(P)H-dependent oxidoreductase [Burkholderiales bacterium]|nr:NAD(P)H-dependent oxidoreductase [Burkholderiales bacterium]